MRLSKTFKSHFYLTFTREYSSGGEQTTEARCVPGSIPGTPIINKIFQQSKQLNKYQNYVLELPS